MKHRFAGDVEDDGARQQAKSEEQRADKAVRELQQIRSRIRVFNNCVDFVQFNGTKEEAPTWAEGWLEYLLTGAEPVALPATVEDPASEDEAAKPADEQG